MRHIEQGVIGAARDIVETPPAFGQAEGQIEPGLLFGAFEQHHPTARRQQGTGVRHRRAEVARRMHGIRRHDDIVAAARISLRQRVFFDIEHLVFDKRIVAETLARPAHKAARHVGVAIVAAFRRQQRQQMRRGAAGAGADFEHAQTASRRQLRQGRHHGAPQRFVDCARARRIGIKTRGCAEIAAGE